jgi:DNA (cytosine-5)-methyltransferase 1
MKILDLFCGVGGAAMGYHIAFPNAWIVGVDNVPQPDYPFQFIQRDALTLRDFDEFDLVHASPPCQHYSVGTRDSSTYPDLVGLMARRLVDAKVPYVIENVMQAPMRKDLMLCGSMFGLQIQRHRIFEHNLDLPAAPSCEHTYPEGRPYTVTGHGGGVKAAHSWNYRDVPHAQSLMEIRWTEDRKGIVEAVPPAYTHWIGMNKG